MLAILLIVAALCFILYLLITMSHSDNEPTSLHKVTEFANDNGGLIDYTHSFWLSLDQIGYLTNDASASILNFGNNTGTGTSTSQILSLKYTVENQLVLKYKDRGDSSLLSIMNIDIPLQRWHHIAIVSSGHDLDLYMNGTLVATREIFEPSPLKSVTTKFGDISFNAIPSSVSDMSGNENYGRFFNYKYYAKALSHDEIKDLAVPVRKLENENNDVEKGYGLDLNISKGSKTLGSISL